MVIYEQNTLRNPKYGGQNLACWCLCLVTMDSFYLLLSTHTRLPIWLQSEVVDPCFIHCHIFTQKLLFVALNQLQTRLWNINALFLINCQQMWHPLWTQLSHWQMFMQNGEYTVIWYLLQLLCYLMQLQFMISQNKFVELFAVFRDNCQIWVTWAFSIICVSMIMFKVSILPLNHCFRWRRVRITFIKPLLCLNSIFPPIRKQCFINTQNSDFSIVLKICNCSFI